MRRCRAGLDSVVSTVAQPFTSKKPTSRVYSRTPLVLPRSLDTRPILRVTPPEPTGLGRLTQSALDTAGSVLSTLGSGAASLFSSCFGQTATGSRYAPARRRQLSGSQADYASPHEPPAYKDDRSEFSVTRIKYSPAPSGSTWSPRKKTGIMSRLSSGLSRFKSSSKPSYSAPYSRVPWGGASMGTGTAYIMPNYPASVRVPDESMEPPPSYEQVVGASQDSREQEAARWLKHQERMNEQYRSDWRSMWSEWIDNGFRPSTNNNASSTHNRGPTGFAAISVPDW